jgi:hypothetical protein
MLLSGFLDVARIEITGLLDLRGGRRDNHRSRGEQGKRHTHRYSPSPTADFP